MHDDENGRAVVTPTSGGIAERKAPNQQIEIHFTIQGTATDIHRHTLTHTRRMNSIPSRAHSVSGEAISSLRGVTARLGTAGFVAGDDEGVEGPLDSLESIGNALPTPVQLADEMDDPDANDDWATRSSASDYPIGVSKGQTYSDGRSSDLPASATLDNVVEIPITGKTGITSPPTSSTAISTSQHQNQASSLAGILLPSNLAEHDDGFRTENEKTQSSSGRKMASTPKSSTAATLDEAKNAIVSSKNPADDELPSSNCQQTTKGSSSTTATILVSSRDTTTFCLQPRTGMTQKSRASRSPATSLFLLQEDEATTIQTSLESSTGSSKSNSTQKNGNNEPLNVPPSGDDYIHHHRTNATGSIPSCLTATVGTKSALSKVSQNDGSSKHPPVPTTSLRGRRRHVAFSSVQIRRYPMILADNPACASGPPLSLGWEYELLPEMSMTEFESFRLRSRRLHMNHLILSHYKRVEILQRTGYTAKEIKAVEKEMAKVHRQRQMTALSPFGKLEELAESAGRKVKLGFGRKRTKR